MRKFGWEKLLKARLVYCSDYVWPQITNPKFYIILCFVLFCLPPLYPDAFDVLSLGHRREGPNLHTQRWGSPHPSASVSKSMEGTSKAAAKKWAGERTCVPFVDGDIYFASGKVVVAWSSWSRCRDLVGWMLLPGTALLWHPVDS